MSDDIRIILTDTLRKDYQKLPKHIQKKFDKQLRFLAENPKHLRFRQFASS